MGRLQYPAGSVNLTILLILATVGCQAAALARHSWSLQLLASGLFYGALRVRYSAPLCLAGAAIVALLPGYGLLVLALVALARAGLPPLSGDLLSEFRDHVAPNWERKQTPLAELPLLEHLKVQPLIDLLESPDLEVRKAVLEAMARRRGRQLIERIQRALNDPRPEIYQLAVAKLSQIQEDHTGQLARARFLYERDRSRESAYGLARAYHDYLDSGLLDRALEPLYLEQLAEVYAHIIPQDPIALVQRGHALLRLGRPEQAKEQYQQAFEQDGRCLEALLGLLEVCYQERDWVGLRAQLPGLIEWGARLPGDVRDQVKWLCR